MLKPTLRKIAQALFIVWGVLTITFVIIQLAPGDPATMYLRPEIDAKTVENIRQQMGLDLPLWQQYFVWLIEFSKGNFGLSLSQNRFVRDIFFEAIPNTLILTVSVYILQLLIGIPLGVITALKRNSKPDVFISSLLLFLYSMPGFWLALMAIMLFSLKLGLLPASQMASYNVAPDFWSVLFDRIKHLVLPASVLATPFAASTARFVRSNLIDILSQDYIRTLKAYGVRSYKILFKYALKNTMLPIITLFGLNLPFLLGGAVVTEYIFSWPGMGKVTVNAIFAHDFPVILASTFIAAVAVIIGNQVSDFLYHLVDPRVRLQR